MVTLALGVLIAGCDGGTSETELIPFSTDFGYPLLTRSADSDVRYEVGLSQSRYEELLAECQEQAPGCQAAPYVPGRSYLALSDGGGGCSLATELEAVERVPTAAGGLDVLRTRKTTSRNAECVQAMPPSVRIYSWSPGSIHASVSETFITD